MHCDDVIDDPTFPKCLRDFLEFNRRPATEKLGVEQRPELYATLKRRRGAHPAGVWVRVVMASRLGDVGISEDMTKEHGYSLRVYVDELENFTADKPNSRSV